MVKGKYVIYIVMIFWDVDGVLLGLCSDRRKKSI